MRFRYISAIALIAFIFPLLASATNTCPQLSRNLSRGISGDDVRQLQIFLIDYNFLATDLSTGFFGSKTEAALQKFQCAQNIVCDGGPTTTGWGNAGPRTRLAITQTCTQGASATTTISSSHTTEVTGNQSAADIPPMCTMSVNPSTIQKGQSSALSWSSLNATEVTIATLGSVASGGSQAVRPSETTMYTGTFSGRGGTTKCETTLTVAPASSNACFFNGRVITEGQSVTAYGISSTSSVQNCVPETRTCVRGVLSGVARSATCESAMYQFNNATTSTGANGSCVSLWGQPTFHGNLIEFDHRIFPENTTNHNCVFTLPDNSMQTDTYCRSHHSNPSSSTIRCHDSAWIAGY